MCQETVRVRNWTLVAWWNPELVQETLREGTLREGTLLEGTLVEDTLLEDTLLENTRLEGTLLEGTLLERLSEFLKQLQDSTRRRESSFLLGWFLSTYIHRTSHRHRRTIGSL